MQSSRLRIFAFVVALAAGVLVIAMLRGAPSPTPPPATVSLTATHAPSTSTAPRPATATFTREATDAPTRTATTAPTRTRTLAPTASRTPATEPLPTLTATASRATATLTTPNPPPTPPPSSDPVLVGAGDIASCQSRGDEATAELLDRIAGTVFTLGDNVYNSGTTAEFANCYEPSWGRHKSRTRPSPGNHDYVTRDAAPYFAYFGANAGEPGKGYYSYNLGAWHIIALNSEIQVDAGSAQEQWLRADLAANRTTCTLAYWHKPRFSSGPHGNNPRFDALWQALYQFDADLVLSGHDHNYERFAPQTPAGVADAARGIREFIVGTGGAGLYPIVTIRPNSEVRNARTWGVLKLTLHATSYDWEFVPVAGRTFTDAGSGNCH